MAFSGPARANAYSSQTGLSSMVLQRKHLQGCMGHMISINMKPKVKLIRETFLRRSG